MREKVEEIFSMEKLTVAIADDNEIVLDLLEEIVKSDQELEVVGKAGV